MIIFPIGEEAPQSTDPVSVWSAVEQRQKQSAQEYWLITQPSHAALAGDLAAELREDLFGPIDETVARSISLHDSGWSMSDAEQIQSLRADPKAKPKSFLAASSDESLNAWTQSIQGAEKYAAIGGYIVSRHFERLSKTIRDGKSAKLESFRQREKQRQQRLRASLRLDDAALEILVDALQFCDLLSLYLCSGSTRTVAFDNPKITLHRNGDEYRLEPSPLRQHKQFCFSALRHPAAPGKSGATFYLNL